MNADFDAFPTLERALQSHYRGHADRDWTEWKADHFRASADLIPDEARCAWLARDGSNYRGLGQRTALRHLVAANVDQPCLEEIGRISGLERLELEWPFVATDLSPLLGLDRLSHLSIDSPRKLSDFAPLLRLPALRTLLLTNARRMPGLDWLADAHQLRVIGIEGAIDTPLTINSLAPLASLASLEAFLAVSTRLADKDLSPLALCPRLRFLDIARVAPREAFARLHAERPDLVCRWFDPASWTEGRLRPA
ncbi:hypothetical protein GCM10022280_09880 [Sphingomonas swuensis]|uniref:Leucine-rich repeat domain-containing protein n=1 Tax=Sphingomonas swuensis TaxID=977800 RepID=A0ABP7SML4_9SPHN